MVYFLTAASSGPMPTPTPIPSISMVTLNVSSQPDGAQVFIDGMLFGVTPYLTHRMPNPTPLQIEVKAPGYHPNAQSVSLERDMSLNVQLERVQSEAQADAHAQEGTLSRGSIQRVVRQNIGQVRQCYDTQLLGNPNLSGRVVVNWVIGETGEVSSARVADSSLGSPEAEACIISTIQRWRFPQPEGGEVNITYPFIFQGAS